MLLTSRSPVTGLDFQEMELRHLEESEVTAILTKNGILPPENQDFVQLLRTPMMLSIFIKTVLDGEKQLLIAPEEQAPQKSLKDGTATVLFHGEDVTFAPVWYMAAGR